MADHNRIGHANHGGLELALHLCGGANRLPAIIQGPGNERAVSSGAVGLAVEFDFEHKPAHFGGLNFVGPPILLFGGAGARGGGVNRLIGRVAGLPDFAMSKPHGVAGFKRFHAGNKNREPEENEGKQGERKGSGAAIDPIYPSRSRREGLSGDGQPALHSRARAGATIDQRVLKVLWHRAHRSISARIECDLRDEAKTR
jgi:hypothetical protein